MPELSAILALIALAVSTAALVYVIRLLNAVDRMTRQAQRTQDALRAHQSDPIHHTGRRPYDHEPVAREDRTSSIHRAGTG